MLGPWVKDCTKLKGVIPILCYTMLYDSVSAKFQKKGIKLFVKIEKLKSRRSEYNILGTCHQECNSLAWP